MIAQYFNGIVKKVPKIAVEALQLIAARLDNLLGDYGKEIRGISEAMGVDLGTLVILNFSYELRSLGGPPANNTDLNVRPGACTSIVAQDAQNSESVLY